MSSREIAQEVGCHLGTIEKIRYRNDIPTIRGHGSPGDKNPSWKGGRVVDQDGYVLLHMPDHPDSDSHGRIREHRWVMEQRLGRRLLDTEVVHHVDTNSGNNDPRNLMLFGSNGEHLHYERKGKRPEWSEEGWKRILEAVHRKKGKRQGGDRRAEGRPRGPIGRFVPKGQDSDGQRLP